MEEKLNQLKARLATVRDLEFALEVLNWDMETKMPDGGAEARADQIATVETLAHQYLVDEEIGELLDDLRSYEQTVPYESDEASIIRVNRREYEKEVRVPLDLVEEMARTASLAHHAWVKARQDNDFSHFEPLLTKTVELQKRWASCFDDGGNLYNPLLDKYEPGIDYAQIDAVFSGLKPHLVKLVEQINANQDRVSDAAVRFPMSEEKQLAFGREVTAAIGYDYHRGRLDLSAHPFSITLAPTDVRITTRVQENFPPSCLMGCIHEAGHGMYEQNVSPSLYRTRLDSGASMAVHESQSRFYENVIGRSRAFWKHFYPKLQAAATPHLDSVDPETFYKAINKSEPSPIRVEADEVTYGLHIILRFELENDLINGRVKVADLPDEWNQRMEAYLGITPPNDAQGVLQDIHWSHGYFGYFPDYLLGSIFSVQLWEAMQAAHPNVEAEVERGEFGMIGEWLRANIHQHGLKFTLPELSQQITGGPLRWEPYMNYLQTKYGDVYGL